MRGAGGRAGRGWGQGWAFVGGRTGRGSMQAERGGIWAGGASGRAGGRGRVPAGVTGVCVSAHAGDMPAWRVGGRAARVQGRASFAPVRATTPPPPGPGTDQAVRGGRHGQKLRSGFPPPGRWMSAAVRMPAVVWMPAYHSRRFKGERPIGAATG